MNISIICSNREHPIYSWLKAWVKSQEKMHDVKLVTKTEELTGGHILFLISCNEVINFNVRNRYNASLLIHASDLPLGRGWSPHVWQILEGKNYFRVTMLEAEDSVDTGAIWAQREFALEGHELYDEINDKLFSAELELLDFAVMNFDKVIPRRQDDRQPTYYRQRTSEDSRLDPKKSFAEHFDLLRVADPNRFPAFFDYRGHRYYVQLTKKRDRPS